MKDKYHPEKLLPHMKYPEYPVMIDFDITNVCNNKCPKCIGIAGTDSTTMKLEDVVRILDETRKAGVKGIIFSGGGEPTCHPHLDRVLNTAYNLGFTFGVNTNGTYINDKVLDSLMKCWTIRMSLDASNRKERMITHGVDDYDKVINNIKRVVDKKGKANSSIDIIITYLIGEETKNGIYSATKMLKDIGVNEVRFRPFFGEKIVNEKDLQRAVLESDKDKNFVVSYPDYRIHVRKNRGYNECLMTNFLCSITPDQHVRPCCILKERGYTYGSLEEKSFKEIWKNKYKTTIFKDCVFPCPHDNNNEFLWSIKQMKVTNII